MQNSQGILHDLTKFTVAVQEAGNNRILGTGVILTDDGLISTCYHCVYDIQTRLLDKTVNIYFPELKQKRTADVIS